jgi:hypothetical protein
VNRPEGDPPGSSPPGDPLSRFLDGLHDHFATYRPQGSAAWNFGAAFRRLEEAWGRTFATDRARALGEEVDAPDSSAPGGPRSLSQRIAGRLSKGREEQGSASAPDADRTEEGFDATLEALRFLAARVATLEHEAAARAEPVEGLAWFEPDDASSLLVDELTAELTAATLAGPVLHVECGGGELLARLRSAGIDADGADPRGGLALSATASRGIDVGVGDALGTLSGHAPGSRGAVVLSGVVDREPLPQLVMLLDAALGAVAPEGVLAVVSRGPASVSGWAAVAQDLLPGRPLHAETWELLLRRAGCSDVHRLAGDDAGGPYAVVARKAR